MKRTTDGVFVPDDLHATALAHQVGGGTARLSILANGAECSNCGGAKMIALQLLSGHGTLYPQPKTAQARHNGRWYASRLQTWPCPVCNTDDHLTNMNARLEASGLELSEREWSLDYLDRPAKSEAVKIARAMIANTQRPIGWLYVYGDNGMGKSGLLKALVAAMCRVGCSARYTTAEDILTEIYDLIGRSRSGDDSAEYVGELIHRYERYQILAVDEIGVNRVADTQFALSKLFNILDTRYNRREELATVIASNNSPAQLAANVNWRYLENRTRDGARVLVAGEGLRG